MEKKITKTTIVAKNSSQVHPIGGRLDRFPVSGNRAGTFFGNYFLTKSGSGTLTFCVVKGTTTTEPPRFRSSRETTTTGRGWPSPNGA